MYSRFKDDQSANQKGDLQRYDSQKINNYVDEDPLISNGCSQSPEDHPLRIKSDVIHRKSGLVIEQQSLPILAKPLEEQKGRPPSGHASKAVKLGEQLENERNKLKFLKSSVAGGVTQIKKVEDNVHIMETQLKMLSTLSPAASPREEEYMAPMGFARKTSFTKTREPDLFQTVQSIIENKKSGKNPLLGARVASSPQAIPARSLQGKGLRDTLKSHSAIKSSQLQEFEEQKRDLKKKALKVVLYKIPSIRVEDPEVPPPNGLVGLVKSNSKKFKIRKLHRKEFNQDIEPVLGERPPPPHNQLKTERGIYNIEVPIKRVDPRPRLREISIQVAASLENCQTQTDESPPKCSNCDKEVIDYPGVILEIEEEREIHLSSEAPSSIDGDAVADNHPTIQINNFDEDLTQPKARRESLKVSRPPSLGIPKNMRKLSTNLAYPTISECASEMEATVAARSVYTFRRRGGLALQTAVASLDIHGKSAAAPSAWEDRIEAEGPALELLESKLRADSAFSLKAAIRQFFTESPQPARVQVLPEEEKESQDLVITEEAEMEEVPTDEYLRDQTPESHEKSQLAAPDVLKTETLDSLTQIEIIQEVTDSNSQVKSKTVEEDSNNSKVTQPPNQAKFTTLSESTEKDGLSVAAAKPESVKNPKEEEQEEADAEEAEADDGLDDLDLPSDAPIFTLFGKNKSKNVTTISEQSDHYEEDSISSHSSMNSSQISKNMNDISSGSSSEDEEESEESEKQDEPKEEGKLDFNNISKNAPIYKLFKKKTVMPAMNQSNLMANNSSFVNEEPPAEPPKPKLDLLALLREAREKIERQKEEERVAAQLKEDEERQKELERQALTGGPLKTRKKKKDDEEQMFLEEEEACVKFAGIPVPKDAPIFRLFKATGKRGGEVKLTGLAEKLQQALILYKKAQIKREVAERIKKREREQALLQKKRIEEEKDPELKQKLLNEMLDEEYMAKFRPVSMAEYDMPNLANMFKNISKDWVDPQEAKRQADAKRRLEELEQANFDPKTYKPKLKSMTQTSENLLGLLQIRHQESKSQLKQAEMGQSPINQSPRNDVNKSQLLGQADFLQDNILKKHTSRLQRRQEFQKFLLDKIQQKLNQKMSKNLNSFLIKKKRRSSKMKVQAANGEDAKPQ